MRLVRGRKYAKGGKTRGLWRSATNQSPQVCVSPTLAGAGWDVLARERGNDVGRGTPRLTY